MRRARWEGHRPRPAARRRCGRSGLEREAWQAAQRWPVAARQADPDRPRRQLGATGVSYGQRDIERGRQLAIGNAAAGSRGAQRFGRIGSTSRSATPATAAIDSAGGWVSMAERSGRIGSAVGGARRFGRGRERGRQLSAIGSAGGRVSMAERLRQDVERR